MRLFVGAWPPRRVCELLAGIERPQVPHLRWTTPDQWHVTLCFLGERAAEDVARIGAVLTRVVAGVSTPLEVRAGPALEVLGRSVLCVPVAGLESAAEAVRAALTPGAADGGEPAGPFRGHVTLARTRGGRRVPSGLAGVAFDARWDVGELSVVSSVLDPSGARYATVATATVGSEGSRRHPTSNVRSPLESSRSLQGPPEPAVGTTSSASPDGTPPP